MTASTDRTDTCAVCGDQPALPANAGPEGAERLVGWLDDHRHAGQPRIVEIENAQHRTIMFDAGDYREAGRHRGNSHRAVRDGGAAISCPDNPSQL